MESLYPLCVDSVQYVITNAVDALILQFSPNWRPIIIYTTSKMVTHPFNLENFFVESQLHTRCFIVYHIHANVFFFVHTFKLKIFRSKWFVAYMPHSYMKLKSESIFLVCRWDTLISKECINAIVACWSNQNILMSIVFDHD